MFAVDEIVNRDGASYRLLRLLKEAGHNQLWECQKVNDQGEPVAVKGSKWFSNAVIQDE